MTIGDRIRNHRVEKGWGPEDLAGRAGVSRVTIHLVESGATASPRARTVKRLAIALGVSAAELLGDGGPAIVPPPSPGPAAA